MASEDFGRDLLLSLPPMEISDSDAAIDHLKSLNAFEDTALEERTTRQCLESSEEETNNSQAKEILTKLQDFQKGFYVEKGVTARCSAIEETTDGDEEIITVRSYAEHLDSHNCSSGSWSATWNIKIVDEKTADISGSVAFHAAHTENCNVHTRATREFATKTVSTATEKVNEVVAKFEHHAMSYEEQLAKLICNQIVEYEQSLYGDLTKVFEEELDLRRLRRILPITKTRFKWDSAAQKNVKLLNARKTA